jgi:hypothetical protein
MEPSDTPASIRRILSRQVTVVGLVNHQQFFEAAHVLARDLKAKPDDLSPVMCELVREFTAQSEKRASAANPIRMTRPWSSPSW